MFKNIISPVQAWLLSRGQCVGCGSPISKGTKGKSKKGDTTLTCKCGRIFILETKTNKYRRALVEEI